VVASLGIYNSSPPSASSFMQCFSEIDYSEGKDIGQLRQPEPILEDSHDSSPTPAD
jgi:hypothetical protein